MGMAMGRRWVAHYASGVPAEIPTPNGSLVDLQEAAVARYGSKIALGFFGAEVSYSKLGEGVSEVAEGLRRLGVRAGDRVALVLPNCPQHILAFYAVLRLGAVVVEQNPLYTSEELSKTFADHGARVAIAWDKAVPTLRAMPGPHALKDVVAVDLTRAMPLVQRVALSLPLKKVRALRETLTTPAQQTIPFEDLRAHGRLDPMHPQPGVGDLAAIQYTSGTTGLPKGAMLTHGNLVANAAQGRAWVPGLLEGREVVYAVLPMFHAYGLTLCVTFAISIGARLVLFPKFDVDLVLKAARKHPPTFLPAVPPIYERLATAAKQRDANLHSLRFAISGAMPLPPQTLALWEEVTGGLLVEGYGLTEASPVALGNPLGPSRRPGAVGLPFPSTDIRVVDPENPSVDREPGERGELLLRGPQVFKGYWNNDEETRKALVDGEWLRTGDIVEVDTDGFVSVVDRIKEIIITGGFNVMPSEVEAVLRELPGVTDAAVVGLPAKSMGEQVVAAVTVSEDAFDPAAARAACAERLAAYKVPRRIVVVEELPRSIVGKVLRREVKASLMTS